MELHWWLLVIVAGLGTLLLIPVCIIGGISLLNRRPDLNPQPATNPGVTGAPPASQGSRFDWIFGFLSSRFWKVTLILLLIAIAIAAGRYIYVYFSGSNLYIDWITIALAIAAVAAVGSGIRHFTDKNRLVTYIYVITVVLLVYWFYRYNMLDIPRRYLLYVLVGVGVVMVWNYIKGFAWISLEALLVMAFLMLGYSHNHTWDQFTAKITSFSWSSSVSIATANCVGLKTFTLGAEPVEVNPHGFCSVATWLPADGCIYQQPARSNRVFGPFGNCANSIGQKGPPDVEYMWSAENYPLQVDIDLAQPHKYD